MKLKLFLILLLTGHMYAYELQAQTAEGDWYTPLRNKLLHVTISKDSVVFSKCSFDSTGQVYGNMGMEFKIEKIIGTDYIVSAFKDSLTNYYLFGFSADRNTGRNYMNIESMNHTFLNSSDAENAMLQFKENPLQIILLTKKEIEKIKQKKDISAMTSNDFKKFAEQIIKMDSTCSSYLNKKYKLSHLYVESTARIILSSIGINALVKGDKYDAMLAKFSQDPATSKTFNKMFEGAKK